ncbi:MAG: hypothetical protein K2M42_09275 [Oscillospiraceae bacterium]|nr:hypothetical protein [Oscillospiraceae bacterium]
MPKTNSERGRMSRRKGQNGELELAHLLREHGFPDVRRTSQYCGKTGDAADLVGLQGIHIESKRTERLSLYEAMEQAQRDAEAAGKGNFPTVFHRRSKRPWMVIMGIEDWLELYRAYLERSAEDEAKT